MATISSSVSFCASAILATAFFSTGLIGCSHHDKSEGKSDEQPTHMIRTDVVASEVVLDGTLPPAARQMVSKIVSPFGQSDPNTAVNVPSSGGNGDSLVFAVDQQDNVVLAARTSDGATTLSADSTAVALVRIALGVVPNQITSSRLNEDIRATAAFKPLVSSILADLAIPSIPTADPTVLGNIADVLAELGPVLASQLTETQASTSAAQLATIQVYPSVSTPFPYSLTFGGVDQVEITNPAYLVSNKGLITYSLTSSAGSNEILLEGTPTIDRLTGRLKTITLPNNQGKGFNVTVGQSAASKRANILAIASDLMALLVGETLGQQKSTQCLTAAANALLLPKDIDPVVQAPSLATLTKYLDNAASTANMRSMIKSCADLSDTAELAVSFAKAFIGISAGFFDVKAKVSQVGLMFRLIQFKTAVNRPPITNGVCESNSGNGTVIVNCARAFKFMPEPAITSGQTVVPKVMAFDINDQPTALPADLEFSSNSPDLASVESRTGEITAIKEGSALIKITDPSTGQFSLAGVQIGSLQVGIAPLMPSVAVGASLQMTATFTNRDGTVARPPSGVRWSSANERVARVDPGSGLITGVAVGTTAIQIAVPGTSTATKTTVTVGPAGTIACADQGIDPDPRAHGNRLWKIDMRGQVSGDIGDYVFFIGTGSSPFNSAQEMTCDGWTHQAATSDRVAMCVRLPGDPASTTWTGSSTQWFNGPLGGPLFGTRDVIGGSPGGQWFHDDAAGSVKQRVIVACPVQ